MTDEKPYGERAARHAAQLADRKEAMLAASTAQPAPAAPIGSLLVLLLGVWVLVAIPILDPPYTATGWDTSLRDEGVAAVLILCGLVMRWWPATKAHTAAAVVAGLGGLALVAMGVWAGHDVDRTAVNEVVSGVAVVVAAVTSRSRP